MQMIGKIIFKFMGIYIVQVGTIWGFVEGYTYFRGDHLRNLLGPYWILLYGVPALIALIVTAFPFIKSPDSEISQGTTMITKGQCSPNIVGRDYEVKINEQKKRKKA